MKYDWREYVTRQARWVDFDNDYKTLDLPYMESVMWAFKTLWDKGLVYEGYKVLPYCWRCETPLSSTETKMDDVYLDRQDPAVTIGLRGNASAIAVPMSIPSTASASSRCSAPTPSGPAPVQCRAIPRAAAPSPTPAGNAAAPGR